MMYKRFLRSVLPKCCGDVRTWTSKPIYSLAAYKDRIALVQENKLTDKHQHMKAAPGKMGYTTIHTSSSPFQSSPEEGNNKSNSLISDSENKSSPGSNEEPASRITNQSQSNAAESCGEEDSNISAELSIYAADGVTLKTVAVVPGKGPPPEAPTTCCQSGCANCVWIDYADALKKYYENGGEKAREAIKREVTDPGLKAFLLLEIS